MKGGYAEVHTGRVRAIMPTLGAPLAAQAHNKHQSIERGAQRSLHPQLPNNVNTTKFVSVLSMKLQGPQCDRTTLLVISKETGGEVYIWGPLVN